MAVLICILALLALILFLLFTPIQIALCCQNERISVAVSYLFFRKLQYPREKKIHLKDYTPRRVRKRIKKARLKQRIAAEKAALKQRKEKKQKSPLQSLRLARLLLHLIKDIYRPILSAVRIRVDRLYVAIGTEDAAKTAILYGVAAQGAAYLLTLLDSFTKTKINDSEVAIVANFADSTTITDIKIRLRVAPIRLMGLYIKTLWLITKRDMSDEEKNTENGENEHERKQSKRVN